MGNSRLSGRDMRADMAVAGEMTLCGMVLPVTELGGGGPTDLDSKALAVWGLFSSTQVRELLQQSMCAYYYTTYGPAPVICCRKIAEAEAALVCQRKEVVMHMHVQLKLDELRGPPKPLAHCDMKVSGLHQCLLGVVWCLFGSSPCWQQHNR